MSDIGADEFPPLLMADRVRLQAVQLAPEAIAPALEGGRLDLAFGYLPRPAGTEPARALQWLGLEPRIRLTLPHFMVVPAILAATDLAVVLPRRPALRFAARHALQVLEPDLGLPPFPVAMHWSWRHTPDPGHRWLRERALAMRFESVSRPPRGASASAASAARTPARSGR